MAAARNLSFRDSFFRLFFRGFKILFPGPPAGAAPFSRTP
jgi:hypothetical protein